MVGTTRPTALAKFTITSCRCNSWLEEDEQIKGKMGIYGIESGIGVDTVLDSYQLQEEDGVIHASHHQERS